MVGQCTIMFNMDGEVIGVNSAIVSPSGGNVGIGFAIPIQTINKISNQLIKYGNVTNIGNVGITYKKVYDM